MLARARGGDTSSGVTSDRTPVDTRESLYQEGSSEQEQRPRENSERVIDQQQSVIAEQRVSAESAQSLSVSSICRSPGYC